ncbi:DUF6884 domain-containing protein [Pseudofrankia sp. DC12]|uniref:DUF6884 domain-containing protein n=1 Tax=Pseudofrankia sp. DC12 TaxID=683315 RepID=UPI0005F83DE1|nr:DUF6884 domain-containing protein [Pseudofrankia sp. DC12]
MTTPGQTAPAVIIGCSRRKTSTTVPIPALDLYQGGRIPELRSVLADQPDLRRRVWILSAEHGLIHGGTPLLPYDRRLDAARALELRPQVAHAAGRELAAGGPPREVLIVAEPLYLLALADLPGLLAPGLLHWVEDPVGGWPRAEQILTTWSQPCR